MQTWLPTPAEGSTLLSGVASLRPAYASALDEVLEAVWAQDVVEMEALELCRLRIGRLLGADPAPERVSAELAHALPNWPTDERFDARMRTILEYAEQILFDAQEVGDELASRLVAEVGEAGLLVLTYACGLFETTQRAELILRDGDQ